MPGKWEIEVNHGDNLEMICWRWCQTWVSTAWIFITSWMGRVVVPLAKDIWTARHGYWHIQVVAGGA
jgi:hypothetical protein